MEVAVLVLLIGAVIFLLAFAVTKIPRLLCLLGGLLFPRLRIRKEAYKKAQEVGIQTFQKRYPDEPIRSARVCDEEADRYVVMVFYGNREMTAETYKSPPWKSYLVVAVRKDT